MAMNSTFSLLSNNMSTVSTTDADFENTTINVSVLTIQKGVSSVVSDVLNGTVVVIAVLGVVLGCFVVNIVRKLGDDDLRSRFALLCVLVCEVILSASNLSHLIYIFALIDHRRFDYLACPFVYFNSITISLFSISLTLSLLCLAVDQVIATFKPLQFRTSSGTGRKIVYGIITFMPVPVTAAVVIYTTWNVMETSDDAMECVLLMNSISHLLQYVIAIIFPVIISTPMIYAVVLWKISRQRCVQSENPVEHTQNLRLVVTFLLLSASYFLLWMPTLAYFSICYFSSEGCWETDTADVTLIVHIIFTLNYVIDPITCAVRMEPVKMRISRMCKRH